jgi:hypothetical protein
LGEKFVLYPYPFKPRTKAKLNLLNWSLGLFFLSIPVFGAEPVRPIIEKLSGQCETASIKLAEYRGEYFVKVYFNGSMITMTDPGVKNFDSKRCTIDLSLQLDPGFQFESFTFAVDGTFKVSDQGTGRITVSNTIGNAPAIRNTGFYSLASGSNVQGDLLQGGFSGTILANQLDPSFQHCGSKIPLETSVFTTVTQPSTDLSDMTYIDLDEAKSVTTTLPQEVCAGGYCLGKINVKNCR